ncbi:MAG: hypothetical protein UV59_C0028G0004 [Candidatus Gottesmanbacteria bacterium GW2011_GWA1_43_11]|uniref:Uncharacterized protein n=1 Tax=Candidatus Gottesmanbacteria bacterium GW2011_GWA1_43_11 TaxID=1618436 RepID=A0A0G1ELU0_9BACT|nr:MAG: hypothetical protein UV59_C0028G0004 [Candidatus Gottesmanbacteria bacterium GW2011_GWA1_43_11]
MYWATEWLLDESPELGHLNWKFLYDGWQSIKESHVSKSESIDEAKAITWGSIAFFLSTRVAYLNLEVTENDLNRLTNNQLRRELDIISSWDSLSGTALDETSDNFNGDPPNPDLPLMSYPPTQKVEPYNDNSPIFAHLQALAAAANMEPITPELEAVILEYATNERRSLEDAVRAWNDNMTSPSNPETQDPEVIKRIHETSFIILAITMASSWGKDNDTSVRLNTFGEHLQKPTSQTNSLLSLLNEDALSLRVDSFREKEGISQTRAHAIDAKTIKRAKRIKVIEEVPFNKKVASSYATEITGYKNLDFGAIVVWVPKGNYWLGNMIISQVNHEPPRAHSPVVQILRAEDPAQAIMGFIDYLQQNPDMVRLPYKTNLSKSDIRHALKLLNDQKIVLQLHSDESKPIDQSLERASHLISLLLEELKGVHSLPQYFPIVIEDAVTNEVSYTIVVNNQGRFEVKPHLHALKGNLNFLSYIDTMITAQPKPELILCQESLYQTLIKDPQTKIIATEGQLVTIERPDGTIKIHRGPVIQ